MKARTDSSPVAPAPAACPFCRSARIGTAGEKITSSTYWRCEACGEMWNEDRLRSAAGYSYPGRWR